MKTQVTLSSRMKIVGMLVLLVGVMSLISCSEDLCPTYVKSIPKSTPGSVYTSKMSSRKIPSPYTQKYQNHIIKKNKAEKKYASKNK